MFISFISISSLINIDYIISLYDTIPVFTNYINNYYIIDPADLQSKAENLSKQREHTDEEISRLRLAEEELVEVRRALRRAEHAHDGVAGGLSPIMQLQSWLQFTYEIETQYFEAKKEAAKEELRAARVLVSIAG